ncbi:MAG: spermidine/putrescine ABC transporter substrate-binding protein [Acidobacteria bacterium]|nr:spermidine/putrescine ABC transporter substrate-binding protein [Acidobacteriota bacterium]
MTRRREILIGLAGLSGCARPTARRLNVFNWSAYVAPETVPNFEKHHAVKVRYSVYESNEEMLARVFSGNSGWDIVFPTHYIVPPMREQNLLAELDHAQLPNLKNIEPAFQHPVSDPQLQHSVPYMWNATGILYNKKVTPVPSKWADLWEPHWKGHLTMLDDPAEVFAAALRKLGYSLNSRDPNELRAAQREAVNQKPLLRAYLNTEVRDQAVAGDILGAQIWSTTAQQAIDASSDLAFVYPRDGFPLSLDCAVLLRESPRKEIAHDFLNYLLEPNVSARIAETMRTATANGAARPLLSAATQNNRTLYPPPEVMAQAEWFATVTPEAQRLRDRLWTEIKSA